MLKNYLMIAVRNILRHKTHSFINVVGLGAGLCSCLLILLYVHSELSFDRFHKNSDRIYRLVNDVQLPTELTKSAYTSAFAGPSIKEAFPEIEAMARLAQARSSYVFNYQARSFEEPNILFADSTFFEIFSFPLAVGDAKTALRIPFAIVLTQSTARKYFGENNALGEALTAADGQTYTVTGILEDIPEPSHLQFDGLISMSTAEKARIFSFQDRLDLRFATYFLVRSGVEKKEIEVKFPHLIEELVGEIQRQGNFFYTFSLVPLTDVYFHSEHRGLGLKGSLANVITFSAIAFFTLLIACINFMNMTTARSALRAREVGVRKAVGAKRGQLARQFIAESTLLCLISLAAGIAIAWLILPFFNTLSGKSLQMTILLQPHYVLCLIAGGIVIGTISGCYPALVLSGFNPVIVLRDRFFTSSGGTILRKTLVVFQFAVSITLMVGTTVVYQQLRFMQEQNPGFHTEQMLVVDFKGDNEVRRSVDVIKREMLAIPGVIGATASWLVPGSGTPWALTHVEAADGLRREMKMYVNSVDFDFFPTYDLEVVAGRGFSPEIITDNSAAFIINEAAVRDLGYASPDDIIDQPFREWGQEGQIIGVVKDFHYTSLRESIQPMNFVIGDLSRYLTLRLAGDDLRETVGDIEQIWKRTIPNRPFSFRFLDDLFDAQYKADQRFGEIIASFAVFAIGIACLGLFALAAFSAERRTKEIGVRKVLGASVRNIIFLISNDFTKLVLLALVIATPVAWSLSNLWLQDYSYRISVGWWIFAGSGGLALFIALATVSIHAIKAALANPVEALRNE